MKKVVKVAMLIIVLFLLSACDVIWNGPAEITTPQGKVVCPEGLLFRGGLIEIEDEVHCRGSQKTMGTRRDLVFFFKDIVAFSTQQRNQGN